MPLSYGPKAIKKSKITIVNKEPYWGDFETIERKGLGHPDTIADSLASLISQAYSRYTIKNCDGLILHHQVDKLMVIGGKTQVYFGEGKFLNPIRIIVAGRATYSYKNTLIPIDKIVKSTIKSYFQKTFPLVNFLKDVVIENLLTDHPGPGTVVESKGAIANMFSPKNKGHVRGYEKLVANDTSYCLAYSPYSELEKAVVEVEKFLNSWTTKKKFPWLGSDIKIMAVRNGKEASITLCIPQIAKYVHSLGEYKKNLNTIGKVVEEKFRFLIPNYSLDISLNTKDDYQKMNIYLTVSGASLSGDIGIVGRGNRTNGLITSNRPMSLEATNGKNPRYYSGFIYAVVSKKISDQIYKTTKRSNVVEIVSQNGALLNSPWRIRVISSANKNTIQNIIKDNLNNIEKATSEFISGKLVNY